MSDKTNSLEHQGQPKPHLADVGEVPPIRAGLQTLKYPNIGAITATNRHSIMVMGPFTQPPCYRCEYQYAHHSGSGEYASGADAGNKREGSTGYPQYLYLTAIADWMTQNQQRFLATGDVNALSLAGEPLPWQLKAFNNTVHPAGYNTANDLIKRTWLYWPDKVLNLSLLFVAMPEA